MYNEAYEFMFDSDAELFPHFFDENSSDTFFFSFRNVLRTRSSTRRCHHGEDHSRKIWQQLDLDIKTAMSQSIKTRMNQLQIVFQTHVLKTEMVYLCDGMDCCPFRKSQDHFVFACLFGATRQVEDILYCLFRCYLDKFEKQRNKKNNAFPFGTWTCPLHE